MGKPEILVVKSNGSGHLVWAASENTGCVFKWWHLNTLFSLFSWFGYTCKGPFFHHVKFYSFCLSTSSKRSLTIIITIIDDNILVLPVFISTSRINERGIADCYLFTKARYVLWCTVWSHGSTTKKIFLITTCASAAPTGEITLLFSNDIKINNMILVWPNLTRAEHEIFATLYGPVGFSREEWKVEFLVSWEETHVRCIQLRKKNSLSWVPETASSRSESGNV